MKSILLALFMGYSCALFAQSDGDNLFDSNVLHEIRFESPDDFFLTQLINIFNSSPIGEIPYVSGSVRIDGTLISNVGVRIKGGFSAFAAKRPLKIDFNRYVDDQQYDGMTKLNLQNADFDLTVQREAVVYDMFRKAGVKGPRTAFAKVFFNNTYNGVYILVEQVDKNFLRNYFADDEGTLYKNKTCELEIDEGPDTFEPIDEIQEIISTLTGEAFRNALENSVNTESFLRYFAIHHFINAVDSPIDVGCNFYIYHEPRSGQLNWIPWDYNMALFNGANYDVLETNTEDALFDRMIVEPQYRERYLQIACDLIRYVLNEEYLYPQIDHNGQIIRDALMTDPHYLMFDNFDASVTQMKTLIANRRMRFENDLAALGFVCPEFGNPVDFQDIVINELVTSADSLSGIADPEGGYPDWIELYNNSSSGVSLQGFYLSHDRDYLKHWAFPAGVLIGPGEYLAVWADRDVEETGLHADFKLDKDGGQLFLTHEDLSVVDSMEYSEQNTNVAFARVPNGTGDFVRQPPTFLANNGISDTGRPVYSGIQILVSPQPARDVLTVRIKGAVDPVDFRLCNATGQVVRTFSVQNGIASIPTQDLKPGVFFLMGSLKGGQLMKKVVVSGE